MCVVVGVGGHTGLTLVGMERWTPRTEQDKDLMLAKLVQDNETLMGEVQLMAESLQAMQQALQRVQQEKDALEASSAVGLGLIDTMTEQSAIDRREREAAAEAARKQHEADKAFLSAVLGELEAELKTARAEREETQARAEHVRRASQKHVRKLEELLHERDREAVVLRQHFEVQKQQLVEQCEQRVSVLRLQKEQAHLEKGVLKQLERDVGELKTLALGSGDRELTLSGDYEQPRAQHVDAAELEHRAGLRGSLKH